MIRGFRLLSFLFIIPFGLKADLINLIRADQCETIIELFVEEDQLRVTLEIGEHDIPYFNDLFKNEENPVSGIEFLNNFFRKDLIIRADGRLLIGSLISLKKIPRNYRQSLYTNQVDTTDLSISDEVIYAEIIYEVKRPSQISITPPIPAGEKYSQANIGYVSYHQGLPVNDLRYLSQTETLTLNWSDPWYSRYKNKNLSRHHKSSIMSFLYVDPYEVRHEVLARVKDLEPWLNLGFDVDDQITIDQLEIVKQQVADFLIQRNPLLINGQASSPSLDQVNFVEVKLSGIQVQLIPRELDYAAAIIGVIFTYPFPEGIPQEVQVRWDLWNSPALNEVPCVMTDPAGPLPYLIRYPEDSILIWKNHLKDYSLPTVSEVEVRRAGIEVPYLSLLLIILIGFHLYRYKKGQAKKLNLFLIAALLLTAFLVLIIRVTIPLPVYKKQFSKPESEVLISHVLRNVYRSFDYREEGQVYDMLAVSTTGNLLSDLYIQTKKGMVMEEQGGIQVRLNSVLLQEIEEENEDDMVQAIAYRCKWKVRGDVGHWGHVHTRVNEYDAILKLVPEDGNWKLIDLDIIDEQRIQ